MIDKKKYIVPILLTAIFAGINHVEAYTFGVGYADTGGQSVSKPREDTVISETITSGNTRTTHTCTYNYKISVSKKITINGYDMADNEIMKHSLKIDDKNKIIAGTSIGLNVYETKTITWEVTKAEAKFIKEQKYKLYRCEYETDTPPQVVPVSFSLNMKQDDASAEPMAVNCSKHNGNYKYKSKPSTCKQYDGCKITSGPTYKGYSSTYYTSSSGNDAEEYQQECQETAAKAAIEAANKKIYSSYELKMTDSNDVNGGELVTITNESANKTKEYYDKNDNKINCNNSSCKFKFDENASKIALNDTRKIKFYYNKNNVCINVKTSKVTYRDSACNSDEMLVENTKINNLEHWHYFIPLNAKSNSDVVINLLPAYGADLSFAECKYVMENNPIHIDVDGNVVKNKTSYMDLIMPKNDEKIFDGNYSLKYVISGQTVKNEASTDFAEVKNNGCRLTSKIKIPINQNFYNEVAEKNDVKFKGFKFYYRPIDVNNPFPNGAGNDSIWSDWEKSKNKQPDISSSYDEVTYIATNINSSKIRTYTKNNPYTSWINMSINGESNFIKNEGIIVRKESKYSGYKLGCGPSNEKIYLDNAKKVLNPLYIKGCDTK